jgi:AcrR family transcriptional regulator
LGTQGERGLPPRARGLGGLSPRARSIVAAARALLEEAGPAALTMRALADHLGIKAPSLYKHFPDKSAVEVELIAQMLASPRRRWRRPRPTPRARSRPWPRRIARTPSNTPTSTAWPPSAPCPATSLPPGLEDRAAAPLVRACGGDMDLARATWAFAHGMVILEIHGRFPDDADLAGAWKRGTRALHPEEVRRHGGTG